MCCPRPGNLPLQLGLRPLPLVGLCLPPPFPFPSPALPLPPLPPPPPPPPSKSSAASGTRKPKFTMRDDGSEIEVLLPLPTDITSKKDLTATLTPKGGATRLSIVAADRTLLLVDPLWAKAQAEPLYWCLETSKDGQMHVQLTFEKVDEEVEWDSLVKPGGRFECWFS